MAIRTLAVKLDAAEYVEIEALCSEAGVTARDALIAYVRRSPPAATAALAGARRAGMVVGHREAHKEPADALGKAAHALDRAEQLAVRYAEALAWLDSRPAAASATPGPKVPVWARVLPSWKPCGLAIL